ncbi:MAG: helix-turn-helix domain-containing protein [Nanoarchaeota archaeon]
MTAKLSEDVITQMRKLLNENLSNKTIANRLGISKNTVKQYGFAWRNGYSDPSEVLKTSITKRGFETFSSYYIYLANQRGETLTEYYERLGKINSKRPKNKAIRKFMKYIMNEMDMSTYRLSAMTKLSSTTILKYRRGYMVPQQSSLDKLCEALGLGYLTIEDILLINER